MNDKEKAPELGELKENILDKDTDANDLVITELEDKDLESLKSEPQEKDEEKEELKEDKPKRSRRSKKEDTPKEEPQKVKGGKSETGEEDFWESLMRNKGMINIKFLKGLRGNSFIGFQTGSEVANRNLQGSLGTFRFKETQEIDGDTYIYPNYEVINSRSGNNLVVVFSKKGVSSLLLNVDADKKEVLKPLF